MVQYCVVPGCKSNALIPGISFHMFPREPKLKKIWEIRIRRDERHNKRISSCMRVCSEHFMQSDFRVTSGRRRRCLKNNAIPSVFSFNSSNHKISELQRVSVINSNIQQPDENNGEEVETFVPAVFSKSLKTYENIGRKMKTFVPAVFSKSLKTGENNEEKMETFVPVVFSKSLKVSEREETFGHFVACEMSNLYENPELYLRTKQTILNTLATAHLKKMSSGDVIL